MSGALRSFATAYRCGTEPSSQSMPPWSAPFPGTDDRTVALKPSRASLRVLLPSASAGRLTLSLTAAGDAAWLCLDSKLVGAGTPKPPRSFASSRVHAPPLRRLRSVPPHRSRGCFGGVASSRLLRNELAATFWSCHCRRSPVLPDRPRLCTSSSLTPDGKPGHTASLPARRRR